jgi:hypothetical protein
MLVVRGVIRFWPDPLFRTEATRGVQWLTELRLDFQANGQIYANGKRAVP